MTRATYTASSTSRGSPAPSRTWPRKSAKRGAYQSEWLESPLRPPGWAMVWAPSAKSRTSLSSPAISPRSPIRRKEVSRRWAAQVSVTSAMASSPSSSRHARSEEHTSELQSRGHLVCRLLLEKKKNKKNNQKHKKKKKKKKKKRKIKNKK